MFTITYDIVTEESATAGEHAEAGVIIENASLRDAIKALFDTRTCHCDGIECIEANEFPMRSPDWITVGLTMCGCDGFRIRNRHSRDAVIALRLFPFIIDNTFTLHYTLYINS